MTETLPYGNSSESTQRELTNEYQQDRVKMVFQKSCLLVFWMKVASALKGLRCRSYSQSPLDYVVLNISGSMDYSMQFDASFKEYAIGDLNTSLIVNPL